jgi:hypothetical protein
LRGDATDDDVPQPLRVMPASVAVRNTLGLLRSLHLNIGCAVPPVHVRLDRPPRDVRESPRQVLWTFGSAGLGTFGVRAASKRTVTYDVGNVFDPASTTVCKLAKRFLAQLDPTSERGE